MKYNYANQKSFVTYFSFRDAAFFFLRAAFKFFSFLLFLSTPYIGSSRRGEVLFLLEARVDTRGDGSFFRIFLTFFFGSTAKDLPPLRRDLTRVFPSLSSESEESEFFSSVPASITHIYSYVIRTVKLG